MCIRDRVKDVPRYCGEERVTHFDVFDTNETKLNNKVIPILDRLHEVSDQCSAVAYVIETHADQRADAKYNMLLTEGRARAIQDYLLSLGMDYQRIVMNPLGETVPVAQGTSPGDHAKNRRVVIKPVHQSKIAEIKAGLFQGY